MMHRARKRFGQNFLHERGVIERIVQAVHPLPGQALVEIGPGQGSITVPLLKACGRLDVIELDRDLITPLARMATGSGDLVIHQQDALNFDFRTLAGAGKIRAVGNLPYNISTPLLFHLLEQADCIVDMHFMLQKEVVDRIAAAPGGRDYGRLSVMIQYHCRVTPLFRVAPGAFRPAPKIESAFVRLQPYTQLPHPARSARCLEEVVRKAFSQRRKTLRNTLKGLLSEQQIENAGIQPGARAETVGLKEYVALADQLADI
jgi:16S rRNA (adenine1518-N6/adenine1519-N6)-dimethyltransferase